jgi:hypothetical protein
MTKIVDDPISWSILKRRDMNGSFSSFVTKILFIDDLQE